MQTQKTQVNWFIQLIHWLRITRPRIGLRLSPAERRVLLILGDLLMLNGSLIIAATLGTEFHPNQATVVAYWKWFATLSGLWAASAIIFDVYNLARSASVSAITGNMGFAVLLTGMTYLFIPWLTPPIQTRSYAIGFLLVSLVAATGWRLSYAKALTQPAFHHRALILGTGEAARTLMRSLSASAQADNANPFRGTGYRVVGLVSPYPLTKGYDADKTIVGDAQHLVRLARERQVDEIIVALDDQQISEHLHEVLLDCRELGLRISSYIDIYERLTARLPVSYAAAHIDLLFGPGDTPMSRLYAATKRLIDIVMALAGLVALGALIPFVALANWRWSPGPLFYKQERVGQGGRSFAVIKFRSMVPDAEKGSGAVWSADRDPRITPVGQFLRKTRLDELPQVINVLRGEMSMVGPRPERPKFVGQLAKEMPLYRARHAVKPGITGWAQIRYRYGNTVEDSRIKLEYDLYYVKHASLYLDLLIMLQTFPVMLQFKGK